MGVTFQYILLSEAQYAKTSLDGVGYTDEVGISVVSSEGRTLGEFTIRWYGLLDNKVAPKLEVYDDAWKLLPELKPLFDYLASVNNENIEPADLCYGLKALGYKDATPREEERDSNGV